MCISFKVVVTAIRKMNIQFTATLTITANARRLLISNEFSKEPPTAPGQLIMEYFQNYNITNLDKFVLEENQIVTKEAKGIFSVEYYSLKEEKYANSLSCNTYESPTYN